MATNKNALVRYKVLDNCFRNSGKKYFISDLIDACNSTLLEIDPKSDGISRRQIFEDILFMSSEAGWSIPLDKRKDGKKVYYRYSDLSFSINNMPLNETEIVQLESAIGILSQFNGMPQFEWINELIPKLKQGLPNLQSLPTIISFDNNPYLLGIEYFGILHNAILYRKVLSIYYHPYTTDQPFHLIIHPYFLKQYNNRWFVYGYNPTNEKYDWNLALDRIIEIKETEVAYIPNSKINWLDYFEDMIGVSKPDNAKAEVVRVLFYGNTGKYMLSKPIHGSQKSKWIDKNILEIKLEVIVNYELERLLLSYADSICILEPKHLVENIQNKLREASRLHKI